MHLPLFLVPPPVGDDLVKEGEIYGTLQDPNTGQELAHLYNTKEAIVIPGSQNWPTCSLRSQHARSSVQVVIRMYVQSFGDIRTAPSGVTK